MRISDWSSDVCSSDLAPRPFLQPGTNAFRVALTEQLAQRENGPVLRREASKRGQPLVDHTLLCDAELASDRRHQLARSEEHTSELHSLMRISDAGFCLQKNNKHEHITNITPDTPRHNQRLVN